MRAKKSSGDAPMTEAPRVPLYRDDDEISLWALASVLLRRRRLIIALALFGAALGLTLGLTSTRLYTSTAVFIPQGSDASPSGLAAAANQLGIRVATSGVAWGPPLYVELLRSRSLLEPIALDTVTVAEMAGRRVPVMELFGVQDGSRLQRIDRAVQVLAAKVAANEERTIGGVKVSVTTRWPSVSLGLADRLVTGVNEFNSKTRKSQAAAERQFVESQVVEADAALRLAEDRLDEFLQRNRAIAGSPQLAFERDRLQRDVSRRQQLQTSWMQSREEARIREVRDIPVITVLEKPQLPIVGQPRKSVQKAIVGGFGWGMVGVLIAFLLDGFKSGRTAPSQEAGEFFRLVDDATPRFLKKHKTRRS
jgi:capsule polysaccharide export protein KpsE/RkpR